MKTTLKTAFTASLLLVGAIFTGCEKEIEDNETAPKCESTNNAEISTFSEITYCHISNQQSSLSAANVTAVLLDGTKIMNENDVYIYKTSEGRFGKLQVTEIDENNNFSITFNAVTYNIDGSIRAEKSVMVRGTWTCDLDNLKEIGDDFWWERTSDSETILNTDENFTIAKFTFDQDK